MSDFQEAERLRVYVGERDRHGNKLVFEAIVEAARRDGLAGCTVLRGSEGYGLRKTVHASSLLSLAEELPVIIEIVDEPAKIEALLSTVRQLAAGGVATLESVRLLDLNPRPS